MKKIFKNISNIFLSFSILLLIYIFYRSEIYHAGTEFDYYLKYYLISVLFIALSIISFFIEESLKIKITIVLISTLFGLYLIVGYLLLRQYQS